MSTSFQQRCSKAVDVDSAEFQARPFMSFLGKASSIDANVTINQQNVQGH